MNAGKTERRSTARDDARSRRGCGMEEVRLSLLMSRRAKWFVFPLYVRVTEMLVKVWVGGDGVYKVVRPLHHIPWRRMARDGKASRR